MILIWFLSSCCARVAQNPPGNAVIGVNALVIRRYFWSDLGRASVGSWHNCDWSSRNAWWAAFGKGPSVYPESCRVSLNKGAAVIAKFWIWFQKKLHQPTKDRISLTFVGALAILIAFSFSCPGLIPCGVKVNPR